MPSASKEDECGPELLKLIAALDEVEKQEFRAIVEEAIGQLEVEEQKAKEKVAGLKVNNQGFHRKLFVSKENIGFRCGSDCFRGHPEKIQYPL